MTVAVTQALRSSVFAISGENSGVLGTWREFVSTLIDIIKADSRI